MAINKLVELVNTSFDAGDCFVI